jgi:hypothetical protein
MLCSRVQPVGINFRKIPERKSYLGTNLLFEDNARFTLLSTSLWRNVLKKCRIVKVKFLWNVIHILVYVIIYSRSIWCFSKQRHLKYVLPRVKRLGEFSPIGPLFSFGSFLNYKISSYFWASVFNGKLFCIKFDKLGAFWAIFSQTHLVTSNQFHARRVHMAIKY